MGTHITNPVALAEARSQQLPCQIVRGLGGPILRVLASEIELARASTRAALVSLAEDNGLELLQ